MPEPKHRAPRTRERPRLLVDLSGKVSEDLRIGTPTTTPTLKTGPSLKAGPKANGVRSNAVSLAGVGLRAARASDVRAARRVTPRITPQLRERIKAKIRDFIPDEGEVIWTLVFHEWWDSPGSPWVNEMEYMFWLGADRHLDHSIDEWMNSEWEHVCDILCDPSVIEGVDLNWGDPREGLTLLPTGDQLHQAWEEVSMDRPSSIFLVPVIDASESQVTEVSVSAQDLMDPFGLSREAIMPVVVIADRVLLEDHEKLMNDEEVYLYGYWIDRVEEGEFTIIHIVPPPQ